MSDSDNEHTELSTQHSAPSTVLGGVLGWDERGHPYHELAFRVTVLDTDVFNLSWERYMPWCERNATELHVALGITNERRQQAGVNSLLRGIETRYLQPAYLDDVIRIHSSIETVGNSSEQFLHRFYRDDTLLVEAKGTLVWVGKEGRPVYIPDWARQAIGLGSGHPATPPTPLKPLGGVFGRDEQGRPYHEISFRVSVLDTDVYNLSWERYLPWGERNATELNYALGIVNARLKEEGLGMYMSQFSVDYRQPAYLDDIITLRTTIERVSAAALFYRHQFYRADTLLVESPGSLVWVNINTQRPARVPDWVRQAIVVELRAMRQGIRANNVQPGYRVEVMVESAKRSAEADGAGSNQSIYNAQTTTLIKALEVFEALAGLFWSRPVDLECPHQIVNFTHFLFVLTANDQFHHHETSDDKLLGDG